MRVNEIQITRGASKSNECPFPPCADSRYALPRLIPVDTMPIALQANRSGRSWVGGLALLAAFGMGAVVGSYLLSRPATPQPQGKSAADVSERITALARLQPSARVVPISGPPGDRIEKMEPLYPGQKLLRDQPIATLSSHAQRQVEVDVATQQLTEANDQLTKATQAGEKKIAVAEAEAVKGQAGKAEDLAALTAQFEAAAVQAEAATSALTRLQTLRSENVKVADEDFDRVRLQQTQAAASLAAARSALKKAGFAYAEGEKTAAARIASAKADLAAAIAQVPIASSTARLKLAAQLRDSSILKAPVEGTVLSVSGRVGQPTGLTPILQMADLTEMTAVAEVYESDVGKVLGWLARKPVSAEVSHPPSLATPLQGVVKSERDVARMIARNQVFPAGPREDADRRVVEVVVHLDDAAGAIAARYVGLQVTVTLTPGK